MFLVFYMPVEAEILLYNARNVKITENDQELSFLQAMEKVVGGEYFLFSYLQKTWPFDLFRQSKIWEPNVKLRFWSQRVNLESQSIDLANEY